LTERGARLCAPLFLLKIPRHNRRDWSEFGHYFNGELEFVEGEAEGWPFAVRRSRVLSMCCHWKKNIEKFII
jgi:hypothetical protein